MDNPSPDSSPISDVNIRFKSTGDTDYSTRVLIVTLIILFLLFTYYLIGGYTQRCGCGEGFNNCCCSDDDHQRRGRKVKKWHRGHRPYYDHVYDDDYDLGSAATGQTYGPLY